MSSRLKRKLGDLGIDPSSARANESFCLIGTPLPPLEKSKDNGEFVPLWKQDVRDEKGRRRLHGAFTGGFSAGYFNSVGSKEGWTPATFVSSRGERAKQKAARPEDFMDEEDLQELKDSRSLVDTTDEMDLLGGTQAELQKRGDGEDPEQDSIASALAASLLPAPKDSAGARILKKMGWRIGQGIGPRVTLRQRKLQDMQARLGQKFVADAVVIPDDDDEADKHTYAPRDTPILLVERKDNSHGLGYVSGMGLNESLGVKGGSVSGPKLSSGFGLGALNDADEDDLDIYDGGVNNSKRRTAYDHADREEDDKITIGNRSDKSGRNVVATTTATTTATFRDGQRVLPGFVLSDKPVAEDRWFPLPDIPKGWTPDPSRVWGNNDQDKENAPKLGTSSQPVPHHKWKSHISADERGTMLGETPLPSAPKSVFEFMSQKDRERLQNMASRGGPPAPGDKPTPVQATPATITIPRTELHVAQAALRGSQPFTTDPDKQARYTAYLQSQAAPGSTVDIKPIPGQKVEEFNKELEDYAKAALIFKPISGAMAGRFTSAAVVDHGHKIHEGLHTPTTEEIAEKEAEERKREEDKISPKAHAAKLGMYGPLTREVKPWQPAKLLCKRFGVKDPNPPPDPSADVPAPASSSGSGSKESSQFAAAQHSEAEATYQRSNGPRDLSNIGLGEDESQGRDTLTYERPAMDVFKAIFASDDEDSDDDTKDDEAVAVGDIPKSATEDPPKQPSLNDLPLVKNPAQETIPAVEETKVDIATFKPTFIPRDNTSKAAKEKGREKKEKRKKDKKATLVSFEMDEGGMELPPKPPKDRPKKKKRKEKEKREDDDDDGMWVEKPAPEAVKELLLQPLDLPSSQSAESVDPPKGRKRAIDFM